MAQTLSVTHIHVRYQWRRNKMPERPTRRRPQNLCCEDRHMSISRGLSHVWRFYVFVPSFQCRFTFYRFFFLHSRSLRVAWYVRQPNPVFLPLSLSMPGYPRYSWQSFESVVTATSWIVKVFQRNRGGSCVDLQQILEVLPQRPTPVQTDSFRYVEVFTAGRAWS